MLPLQALSMTLTVRILGREGYGHVALFSMVADFVFLISVNWSLAAVMRFGREEFAQRGKLNRTFWARNAIVAPALALLLALSIVFKRPIAGYMQAPLWVVWLLVAQVAVRTMATYLQYILQAARRMKSFAVAQAISQVLYMIGLALIFIGLFEQSYLTVITMGILMTLIGALAVIGLLLPRGMLRPVSWDRSLAGEVFSFSYPIIFGSLAAYVVGWVDVIVINHHFALIEVGGYQLAYRVMTFVQAVSMSIATISAPILVSFLADEREDLIRRYASRLVAQGTLAWSVIVALGMIAAPFIFHTMFGRQFFSSAVYFDFLSLGLAINILASFYSGVLTTYKLIKPMMAANVLMALINLVGDLALVPRMGPSGAALSTGIAFAATAVLYVFFAQRRLEINLLWQPVLVLPVAAVFGLRLALGANAVILPAIAAIAVGYLLARQLSLFHEEDLSLLDKVHMPAFVRRGMTQTVLFLSR